MGEELSFADQGLQELQDLQLLQATVSNQFITNPQGPGNVKSTVLVGGKRKHVNIKLEIL